MSQIPPIDIASASVKSKKSQQKQNQIQENDAIQEINDSYAFAIYGNGTTIIKTDEKRLKFLTEDSFKSIFNNCYIDDGNGNAKKLGQFWLGSPIRREYKDVVFYPGNVLDHHVYNMWKGFSFKPREGACDLFLDHIRANLCDGKQELYEWVLDWMADAIQKPHRKNWTAILLQSSNEGTGKGFFANHFGKLFGTHFGAYNKPGQLIGKFNSHLEDKLIVFLDEGSLVEKYAYDFVKSLITEPTLNIEPKGRSIREIDSYHRLIVASNDHQVIRASQSDRRWCVLNVQSYSQGNLSYFDAIENQLKDGGYEALLFMLWARQYNEHTVKTAPKTEGLNKQKEQNIPPTAKWWQECLLSGSVGNFGWPPTILTSEFYSVYIDWCDRLKINRREYSDWLPRRLNEEVKTNFKSTGGGTSRFYTMPLLAEARGLFEDAMGYTIEWGDLL